MVVARRPGRRRRDRGGRSRKSKPSKLETLLIDEDRPTANLKISRITQNARIDETLDAGPETPERFLKKLTAL
jgi:hypothetical protein